MFELLEASTDVSDPATITVPNTDTTLKSFNIPENKYTFMLISATILVDQSATATAQSVSIKIKDGTTVAKTLVFKTYAALKYDLIPIIYPLRKTTSGPVVITVSAGAADAQTAVGIRSFFIAGIN